ncbi:hypothetical protein QUA70_05845 [Microcoleus sp. LAD1_D5]|uniref:hypothetical protein n=1 Tax=unclassified Microcoleus TaxID=2642155 RepID=UPI002FD2B5AB
MSAFTRQLNRDASDTIRGYVYQVDLTIERWLSLQPGEFLELECGEDIDKIYRSLSGEEERRLEQVKNYNSSVTLWSAVTAIANFVEHRKNNSQETLNFLYTTTALVTKERPSPEMLKKKEGIFVWEQLRQGTLTEISQNEALEGIRIILSKDSKPEKCSDTTWAVFRNFITAASNEELLDLICSFEWSTNTPDPQSLRTWILQTLIKQEYATNEIQAKEQYQRLFLYVFKLLSQPDIKQLTVEERTHQLSLPTLSDRDHNLLQNLIVNVLNLESRVGTLEQNFTQLPDAIASQVNDQVQRLIQQQGVDVAINYFPTPPNISIPLLAENLSHREQTVKSIISIFNDYSWIAIDGMAGAGKTHLAILVAQAIGTCRAWVRLRDLTRRAGCQQLDAVCRELTGTTSQSNQYEWYCQLCERLGEGAMLVLDDLPELSGSDELSEKLIQLTRACRLHDVRILSTSPYQLPFSLEEFIGNTILHSMKVPLFTDDEAAEILQSYGAPSSLISANLLRGINAIAQQHPVLLTTIARDLSKHSWQLNEEVYERLLKGEYQAALNSQITRRVLDSVEDENTRELLYRLCLPVGSFSLIEVQAVASVNRVLERPSERLHTLVGLWVQRDVDEGLLISPLVKQLGENNLLVETKKSCHLALGNLIVSRHQLSPQDVLNAIIHFLGAEVFDRAGLMLISALRELNSMEILVNDRALLSLWGRLPLPEQMDLDLRIFLRGEQIAARHKYGKSISYLVQDLDTLLEQASDKNAIGVLAAMMATNSVFDNDPIRANRYLRTALHFLPYAQIPGSNEPAFSDEGLLGFMIWTNSQGITSPEHLRDWISTIEQLTLEQRQFAFNHEVAEQGCLVVSEKLWLKEAEKPQEEQDWSAMLAAYEDLAERANKLDLELLWACAIRSKIIVLGDYLGDVNAIVAVAQAALQQASEDPRVRFLIQELVGQKYVLINQKNHAVIWLSKALSEETNAYPSRRLKVLIYISIATGEQDAQLAVEFARQAVNLAETNSLIDKSELVKALGELAISQWLAGNSLVSVFESWEQAGEQLLACRSDTEDWKKLFVVYGHVSGYFSNLARTGSPPTKTLGGEDYAAPQRGILFSQNPGLVDYYDRNRESTVLVNLTFFAASVGNDERAAVWALRGIDDARDTNQRAVFARLSLEAFPYLLLDARYAEVLDFAMDAGAFFAASTQLLQIGQLPQGFELDVETILGNKPSEIWRKAEHNAALVGLLPVVFRIGTVALRSVELARSQATEVAAICRQISATAVKPQLWLQAAELLEQIYLPEVSYSEILDLSNRFDPQTEEVFLAIGYLVATQQNDTPLETDILLHMAIAPFIYQHREPLSATYRQVILPFFIDYWKIKFERVPLRLRSTSLVSGFLNRAENLRESQRLQFVLGIMAFALNVRLPPDFANFTMASAPEVASFLSEL